MLRYWSRHLSSLPLECQKSVITSRSLSSIILELMFVMELPFSLTLSFTTCQEFVPLKCTFLLQLILKWTYHRHYEFPIALFSCCLLALCDLVTFTSSESNGKVQYNIRTTKNVTLDIPVVMLTPYECVELRYWYSSFSVESLLALNPLTPN